MGSRTAQLQAFERLLDIMDELREKCPWDRKQTFETLRHLTIEETYELGDAILDNDLEEIKKELGDLLLHIVFYSKIGSEKKAFDIADVANQISDKLIHRHPHIYGETDVEDADQVVKNWEDIKLKEGKKSVLEGVPKSLPALVKAYRIQDKVSGVGFDWDQKEAVLEKVKEELDELRTEIDAGDSKKAAGCACESQAHSPGGFQGSLSWADRCGFASMGGPTPARCSGRAAKACASVPPR